MDYEQIQKIMRNYIEAIRENTKIIIKKYKDKCSMVIEDEIRNRVIEDKFNEVLEERINDLKRKIDRLISTYEDKITKLLIMLKNAENINDIERIINDFTEEKVFKKIYNEFEMSAEDLRRDINLVINKILDIGVIDSRYFEEFQYEFYRISRNSVETLFDDFSFDRIEKIFLAKLGEYKEELKKQQEGITLEILSNGFQVIIDSKREIDFLYDDNRWIIKYGNVNNTREYSDPITIMEIVNIIKEKDENFYNNVILQNDSLRQLISKIEKDEKDKVSVHDGKMVVGDDYFEEYRRKMMLFGYDVILDGDEYCAVDMKTGKKQRIVKKDGYNYEMLEDGNVSFQRDVVVLYKDGNLSRSPLNYMHDHNNGKFVGFTNDYNYFSLTIGEEGYVMRVEDGLVNFYYYKNKENRSRLKSAYGIMEVLQQNCYGIFDIIKEKINNELKRLSNGKYSADEILKKLEEGIRPKEILAQDNQDYSTSDILEYNMMLLENIFTIEFWHEPFQIDGSKPKF